MKPLTHSEEQIMQHLWDIKKGLVKDLLDEMPSPKPAYNTVSTFVRILEKKGFVKHRVIGKSHEYFPIVTKDEYRRFTIKKLLSHYFGGSFVQMTSFFAKKEKLNQNDIEKILNEVKQEII
ncbi:MAG: BlaI/MecI/CopY family transcriptional regulator [Cyclobacteriaceae bacterium]